jgi:hypothetical protein
MMARGGDYYVRTERGGDVFLALWTSPRADTLFLDIGWSRHHRFPFDIPRPSLWEFPPSDSAIPDEGWLEFTNLVYEREKKAWLGWRLWVCSVSSDHPEYKKIFIQESIQPVSQAEAHERVANAVPSILADILAYLPSFIENLGFS